MFLVYIIHSKKLNKFYVGFTTDLEHRLQQHNSGLSTFTSRGIPWEIVHVFHVSSEHEARMLEKKIKGRGIKRFLLDNNITC
jgi:putative endonuclease